MPLRTNIGLSKKVGLPDYGSLGASCHVEVELDASILDNKPAEFHNRVQRIYQACREAVEAELAGQTSNGTGQPDRSPQVSANGNGATSYQASEKQLDYIHQLANQIKGLGPRKLDGLAKQMFNKTLPELNSLDASSMIDTLKEIKAGKLEIDITQRTPANEH